MIYFLSKNKAYKAFIFVSVFLGVTVFGVQHAEARETYTPEVRIFRSGDFEKNLSFQAYSGNFAGGADVAIGDLGGDGVDEIITGAGPGGGSHLRLFRQNGSFITGFFAYETNMQKGIHIASGDLDCDGKDEIVTGPRYGGGPFIRVFDGQGMPRFTAGFYAFAEDYHGGVEVTTANIDDQCGDEIVVATGKEARPHVRIFDRFGKVLPLEYFPFAEKMNGGVSIAKANVDGGGEDELIMGVDSGSQSRVKVYKTNTEKTVLGEWRVYADDFYGGINVEGADIDGDGYDEILVVPNSDGGPHVRIFEANGKEIAGAFFAYEKDFTGGVNITGADLNKDGKSEIIVAPNREIYEGGPKRIKIIIGEQKLYAYEGKKLVNSFLISSGLPGFETPRGKFTVYRKLLWHDYIWTYGPGSPLNYNLPRVQYNLNFAPHYYIHYAYWHNNFGKKMSHGCVNVNKVNSEWVYNWAEIGTPVEIVD
ncbi:MAG: hypothetical protein A3B74_04845 [Candidatus Kerfeldbacteria bacterium RIFCSPHIGHO2_02_FULL_42_14]|uniref:L,D-TPase catalytic domain-containing protein n=1 Tax=Candidatus Kerfeldbacteria bacterium RIFCSPHIGHO2_02_FULL_42_14 TaxID=1798540 RepID=A0A1G2AP46_9BACT|nr:MAG: hypothetical protein A3B74_04845 [Candidatus Kerfeldbacteria bacterium RIFCSPHIGHO2_02_FULL_42_14]OGY81048.1 MAG: hypothetical protein A3E60_03565 [Candidatus Kerfeldbacteria bacterium RIFCSPHIGHO2_12_FULL_42_13]OGY84866.1 MAG: hypothetical protein A3I91_05210 [Candidatus Kerfeldbacteria bacterium RIFCSPLOWO2_02_FULL_42_19]OGY86779.1 MAG: hypothetical protein A3G01_02510 [Candidatus Kerfeldbacteria bacterium RIFCSPLOWO2_12_FULL_43_9]